MRGFFAISKPRRDFRNLYHWSLTIKPNFSTAGRDINVFKPVLTKVANGFSSGWDESQRNVFTPGALAVVMTGWSGLASIVEIGEIACHYYDGARQAVAPHISSDGSGNGFTINVLPKLEKMRSEIAKSEPQLQKWFEDFLKATEMKQFIADANADKDISESADRCKRLLVEKFGENILILPRGSKEKSQNMIIQKHKSQKVTSRAIANATKTNPQLLTMLFC